MNRPAPPGGEAATWKGLVIIVGSVVLGLAVAQSFGDETAAPGAAAQGNDLGRGNSTTAPTTVPASTTTTAPLRDPKDVKVLVANATATSGASRKVIDALKPACYAVQLPVDAIAKVKAEKRPTTTVYSTPGYEREAATITTRLGLQTTANAALPPDLPIPKTGVPSYNVLVLVGQDLVDTPPQPLPPCEGGATTSTTEAGSSGSGSGTTSRRATTTTRRTGTTARATTTTRAQTTTTRQTTTT